MREQLLYFKKHQYHLASGNNKLRTVKKDEMTEKLKTLHAH